MRIVDELQDEQRQLLAELDDGRGILLDESLEIFHWCHRADGLDRCFLLRSCLSFERRRIRRRRLPKFIFVESRFLRYARRE